MPLENPAGWAATYHPGKIIAEMLQQSFAGQEIFHLAPAPKSPRLQQIKKKASGGKMHSGGTQLNHPIQYILAGKILHFTPGQPPSRAQIILNVGDALKQRAVIDIELELTNHHLQTSIAKRKFRINSIAGTVPYSLDASKVDFYSPKFQNSSIGKALLDLNRQVHAFMMMNLYPLPLEAEVTSVNQDKKEVVINVGRVDGIDFGELFNVYSVTLNYKDPFTQMDLGSGFTRRGVIRVKDVHEGFSIAAIEAGQGFETGELVRSRTTNPVPLDPGPGGQNEETPWWEPPENYSPAE